MVSPDKNKVTELNICRYVTTIRWLVHIVSYFNPWNNVFLPQLIASDFDFMLMYLQVFMIECYQFCDVREIVVWPLNSVTTFVFLYQVMVHISTTPGGKLSRQGICVSLAWIPDYKCLNKNQKKCQYSVSKSLQSFIIFYIQLSHIGLTNIFFIFKNLCIQIYKMTKIEKKNL